MTTPTSGFADVNGANLYYEIAGIGQPVVLIHAGVSDHRQWNSDFAPLAEKHRVLRYDTRGYGKSEPTEGDFTNMGDLLALLDFLDITEPIVLVGCSMGGGMAIDTAVAHPDRVKALVVMGSEPSGYDVDVDMPEIEAKWKEANEAFEAGNYDRTTEIDIEIWFDGMSRKPEDMNAELRQLAYDMNHIAIMNYAAIPNEPKKNIDPPAVERLDALTMPMLVIIGSLDIPFLQLAADYMVEQIPQAKKFVMENTAHLPNMEQPEVFQKAVIDFVDNLP